MNRISLGAPLALLLLAACGPTKDQLKEAGRYCRERNWNTAQAIEALAQAGYLSPEHEGTLREGYAFLRRLQERSRIVHAAASQYLEENAPGLAPLARRMGIRDRTGTLAANELVARYKSVTDRVRAAYDAIVAGEAPA